MKLNGQVALVTGASRGLGRAIALRLAAAGAAVGVNYAKQEDAANRLVAEIKSSGGMAVPIQADVGDPTQAEAMIGAVTKAFGPPSILVNNAGVAWRATLDTFDVAGMERMRRTNVDGLIHVTRFAAVSMREMRYGRIINLSSIAGHGTALPGNAFYAATKAAVSVLTRRFAMELGPFGITVNAVAPGFILTELVKEGRTAEEYEAIVRHIEERSMMGRTGRPEDIAHAVVFLALPESSFITAQILTVDGGRMDYIGHP